MVEKSKVTKGHYSEGQVAWKEGRGQRVCFALRVPEGEPTCRNSKGASNPQRQVKEGTTSTRPLERNLKGR